MIRLFAADLDGTLLNEYHVMDKEIVDGIKSLQKQGRIVSAATGRSPLMCQSFDYTDIYFVSNNGASIRDETGSYLYKDPLPKPLLEEILDRFSHLPLNYVGLDQVYLTVSAFEPKPFDGLDPKDSASLKKVEAMQENFMKIMKHNCSKEEILNAGILKINCHKDGPDDLPEIQEFLDAHKDQLQNAGTTPDIYEITNLGTSKASGVKKLAEILGLDPQEEVAVYGDAGNDLQMLAAFKHSYAPADATSEAKELASEVIGANKDHGVIRHMLKLASQD